MVKMTQWEILLTAFVGSIMAQTGCSKDVAIERVSDLCAKTQIFLGVEVEGIDSDGSSQFCDA